MMKSKRFKHKNRISLTPLPLFILVLLFIVSVIYLAPYIKTGHKILDKTSLSLTLPSVPTQFTPTKNPEQIETILQIIQQSIGYRPKEWDQVIFDANQVAPDLIQVVVAKSINDAGTIEYWTNNRTGTWELLERIQPGQQGIGFCEDWEKLKVAKGMSCQRWVDGQYAVSQVTF
jgi:hypothetical protein